MKKIPFLLAKVFLGVNGLLLISIWARWLFAPGAMLEQTEIATEGVTGTNMLKSGMGGSVLIIGLFIFLYLLKGRNWLYPAMVATAALLGTRIMSIILDGATEMTWFVAGLELLAVFAMWFLMRREENKPDVG